MKRAIGILSLLILVAVSGILISQLRTASPFAGQTGTQAFLVVTVENTPFSPQFESPLPTPVSTPPDPAPTATSSPTPTSSPAPTPSETPISPLPSVTATPAPGEWRQFSDPEAGYTINFPANASVSAGKSKGEAYQEVIVTFKLENVDRYKYQGMSLRVQPNTEGLPIEQIVEQLYKGMSGGWLPEDLELTSQIEETVIAGLPAFQTDVLPDSTSVYLFIPHHDKVYIFALAHELAGIASDPQAETLFYQILDSFRILDGS